MRLILLTALLSLTGCQPLPPTMLQQDQAAGITHPEVLLLDQEIDYQVEQLAIEKNQADLARDEAERLRWEHNFLEE